MSKLKFPLKFERGIIKITRKRWVKEAEKAFNSYYAWLWENIQEWARPVLEKDIESAHKVGWSYDSFRRHLKRYAQMPRRAPRKKVKKEFDANGLPKVTKTPLGPQESALLAAVKYLNKQEKSASGGLKVPKTG